MVKFKVEDANFNKIYPVGSIYMSINETNPSELFGGEWEQIKDTFLLACGDNYNNGATGGSATVTLTANQSGLREHSHGMAHTHKHKHNMGGRLVYAGNGSAGASIGYGSAQSTTTYASSEDSTASSKSSTDGATANINTTGESGTGKNMPPYLAVNVWKRTA